MEAVRASKSHTLPEGVEMIGGEICALCSGWERRVEFKMLSHEQANQAEPLADSWMQLAQNAALAAHFLVLENGPEIPKESGPHVDEGGQVLQGMRAEGCSSVGAIENRKEHTRSAERMDPLSDEQRARGDDL
jgi:hypothetical protein